MYYHPYHHFLVVNLCNYSVDPLQPYFCSPLQPIKTTTGPQGLGRILLSTLPLWVVTFYSIVNTSKDNQSVVQCSAAQFYWCITVLCSISCGAWAPQCSFSMMLHTIWLLSSQSLLTASLPGCSVLASDHDRSMQICLKILCTMPFQNTQ